ncbi:hypothetical protein ASB7_01750 [Helicobacter ailurogastricus]|nr:hypothetical protein ASB7_01750 [Helicobacter ailurogastricus]
MGRFARFVRLENPYRHLFGVLFIKVDKDLKILVPHNPLGLLEAMAKSLRQHEPQTKEVLSPQHKS